MRQNYNNKEVILKVNDFKCIINTPKAIEDKGEETHSLPPYANQSVYLVDEYPACPDNWIHGSSNSSSYFVGIEEGTGLWIDFNQNNNNKHDVAVVISIQGINTITGQKTDKLELEQYDKECPVHKKEFNQDRFCSECGYKWPKQNYLSNCGTPYGMFWLDGFRTPDGKVRQWVFTEEQLRGVANSIIGKDRVFAIGIAFFKSKNQKKYYVENWHLDHNFYKKQIKLKKGDTYYGDINFNYDGDINFNYGDTKNTPIGTYCNEVAVACSNINDSDYLEENTTRGILRSNNFVKNTNKIEVVKKFEVAAGAQIKQEIYEDPNSLEYWEKTSSGLVYVNYASVEEVNRILKAGKRKEVKEGFLANIPVGN